MPVLYHDQVQQVESATDGNVMTASLLVDSNTTTCVGLPPSGIDTTTIKLYPPMGFYSKLNVEVVISGMLESCGKSKFTMMSSDSDTDIFNNACYPYQPIYNTGLTHCLFECRCFYQCYTIHFMIVDSVYMDICEFYFS